MQCRRTRAERKHPPLGCQLLTRRLLSCAAACADASPEPRPSPAAAALELQPAEHHSGLQWGSDKRVSCYCVRARYLSPSLEHAHSPGLGLVRAPCEEWAAADGSAASAFAAHVRKQSVLPLLCRSCNVGMTPAAARACWLVGLEAASAQSAKAVRSCTSTLSLCSSVASAGMAPAAATACWLAGL